MRNKSDYAAHYLQTEHHLNNHTTAAAAPTASNNRLQAARSNEKYPPQPASGATTTGNNFSMKQAAAGGISSSKRRTNSSQDLSGTKQQSQRQVRYLHGPTTTTNQFNQTRVTQQANQKTLLTTQLNFPSSKYQISQAKRAIGSGYSSRNSTQADIPKQLGSGVAGLSNKVPQHAGDNQRSSNDYLRLKRVNQNMLGNVSTNGSGGKDSTGQPTTQKQRINEILADAQNNTNGKTSVLGSDGMSKKSGAQTTADSQPTKNLVNAERAARHARRLQKASSQGAQPVQNAKDVQNAQEEPTKVRIVPQNDLNEGQQIRRKAGSGTRVEQKVADQSSYKQLTQALAGNKTGSSFFVQKHQFVKANISKRGPTTTKQLNEISGIILGNIKSQGGGGHIRQIKDLGSNPGSRVGSHKANVRPGDQTTIIKKQQINPAGGQVGAAERFAQNSIVRGAPKIGMGAPIISKNGQITSRGGVTREGGSQGRQPITITQTAGGSHGAIATAQNMGAQNRPKKGSCHAIFQRMKGQIQIHGSLDAPTTHQSSTQPTNQMSRASSKMMNIEDAQENIPTEECRENKAAFRINTNQDGCDVPEAVRHRVALGHMSSRSNDANKKLADNPMKQHVIKVKNVARARNTGSVEAQKQRDKSLVSTQQSTPEKKEDFELTLWTEIHKNLVAGDKSFSTSPLHSHNISKEYRTKMVDWMVEVTTSFKCTTRTYFLAVAIFDTFIRQMQGTKTLENSDVHLIGVGTMYLASKYEDIYPLHSKVVSEKISHGAFSQKQILAREEEFLKLFQFEMDFITPYDIHQTYVHLIKKRLGASKDKDETRMLLKIEELALLLIRMAMQNNQFTTYSQTMLVYTCFQAAATMLQLSKYSDETAAHFYSDFKLSFMRLANEVERSSPKSASNRDFSLAGRQQVNALAEKLIEFYKIFDSWHCGLNQLKTFKSLSFEISVATQSKVKQALDINHKEAQSRPSLIAPPAQ